MIGDQISSQVKNASFPTAVKFTFSPSFILSLEISPTVERHGGGGCHKTADSNGPTSAQNLPHVHDTASSRSIEIRFGSSLELVAPCYSLVSDDRWSREPWNNPCGLLRKIPSLYPLDPKPRAFWRIVMERTHDRNYIPSPHWTVQIHAYSSVLFIAHFLVLHLNDISATAPSCHGKLEAGRRKEE